MCKRHLRVSVNVQHVGISNIKTNIPSSIVEIRDGEEVVLAGVIVQHVLQAHTTWQTMRISEVDYNVSYHGKSELAIHALNFNRFG